MNISLSSNMEDYLETILILEQENGFARVKQIAKALDITKPSVSAALKKLESASLVKHDKYDLVGLTPQGTKIAEKIYKRHLILKQFLTEVLGVSETIAEQDACKIEHTISSETMNRLIRFVESNTPEKQRGPL